MFFLVKKFSIVPLSLVILLSLSGCGQEGGPAYLTAPFNDAKNGETTTEEEAIPVHLLSIIGSPGGKQSKPYQVAMIHLSLKQADSAEVSTVEVIADTSGQFSSVVTLLTGKDYTISAAAYENADGSGIVRYTGSLTTGIIQPDTSLLTIHLNPASPGSDITITQTYISALTPTEVSLMADITPSSNFTVTYFEWRTANTAYVRTPIQNLGTAETGTTVTESLTGLQAGMTYYFRAVAVNSEGTVPGSEISFTTSPRTALLSWTPPTTNVDGTPLIDLQGYKIYHRDPFGKTTVHDILNSTLPQQQSNTVQYLLSSLAPGTHFFKVSAYDIYGNESAPTPEVSKAF